MDIQEIESLPDEELHEGHLNKIHLPPTDGQQLPNENVNEPPQQLLAHTGSPYFQSYFLVHVRKDHRNYGCTK